VQFLTALFSCLQLQYTKVANHASFEHDLKVAFRDSRQITDEIRLAEMKENAENILLFLKSTRQHKVGLNVAKIQDGIQS
jgi:hypothetical protein